MDCLDIFIQLRIMVATLGEKSHCGWWDSSFISDTGIRYLSYAFPRAPEIAAVQGAVEAARRVHDVHIGATGVTHLFRQTYEVELLILDYLKENIEDLKKKMSSTYIYPNACKASILTIAGNPELGYEGPVKIGTSNGGLPDSKAIKRMAGIYLGAIDSGKFAMPYLLSVL